MSLNGETEIVLEEVSRNRSCSNEVVEVVDDIKHSFTKLSLRDSFSESLPARCFDWDEASIGSRRRSCDSDLFISYSDEDRSEDVEEEERLAELKADESTVHGGYNFDKIQSDWCQYWKEKGEEIVNRSWLQKYKDYINPDFDLTTLVGGTDGVEEVKGHKKNTSVSSTSTDDPSETCDSDVTSATDADALWAAEWDTHYTQTYYDEYNKFLEEAKQAAEEAIMPEDIRRNPNLKKYWVMRYHLFSKYDAGIKLDEESWFSVTPESIAKHIAARCRRVDGVIIDAFCGCGGNTIQFAKKFEKVIAIDIDPVKIEYAKHNARIYGVEDKIDFIVGDYMTLAPRLVGDVVFLSPPWGGPEYLRSRIFDLKTMKPLDGFSIFEVTKNITSNIAFYVPRTTNKNQLMQLAGNGGLVEIEQNIFKSRTKAITAYYGDLIKPKFVKKCSAPKKCSMPISG